MGSNPLLPTMKIVDKYALAQAQERQTKKDKLKANIAVAIILIIAAIINIILYKYSGIFDRPVDWWPWILLMG